MLTALSAGCSVLLAEVASTVRKTIAPARGSSEVCLVLDTSDAREGIIVGQREPVMVADVGSAKKLVEPGDVVISRLRPYLRQVALVDSGIWNWSPGMLLAVSTEFYVLRSRDGGSIAFLVPFLLSRLVQEVLSASQEGGHHPRFHETALLSLPIPKDLIARRGEHSCIVEEAIRCYRDTEQAIASVIRTANGLLDRHAT